MPRPNRAIVYRNKPIRSKDKVEYHLQQATYHMVQAMGSVMWSNQERVQMADIIAQCAKFIRMNEHRPWNRINK